MHPPIPIRRHLLKQRRANVNIILLAPRAPVHNLGRKMLLGLRVPDADHGPAFGVRVGVGPVLEDLVGEGHDVLVVACDPAAGAGADAGAVVGHVARVGVDERGEEDEGEGGEGGDAHCCGDGGGGKGVVAFAGCKER